MNALKKILTIGLIAAATAMTGCNTIKDINDRGQALRAADPAAYEAITGDANYFSMNPEHNVHGS